MPLVSSALFCTYFLLLCILTHTLISYIYLCGYILLTYNKSYICSWSTDFTGIVKCSIVYEILQVVVTTSASSADFTNAFSIFPDHPTGTCAMFCALLSVLFALHRHLSCCLPQSTMQAIRFQVLQAPPFIINFSGDLKYGMLINSY